METERRTPSTKSVLWGLFFMLLGTAFLLDRMHVITMPPIETLWPVILYVAAAGRFIDGRVGSGVTNLLLGTWLLACTTHWNGMTFASSWPLALIAVGTGIVVRALTGEDRRRWPWKKEE
jgi:hypothetical protein